MKAASWLPPIWLQSLRVGLSVWKHSGLSPSVTSTFRLYHRYNSWRPYHLCQLVYDQSTNMLKNYHCISNITSFPCPPPTPHPPTRDLCPGASIDRRRVSCVLAAQPATRPRQPGVQQRLCHVSPWQWWCWLVRLRVWQGIHGGSVITRSTIAKSEGLYKAIDK